MSLLLLPLIEPLKLQITGSLDVLALRTQIHPLDEAAGEVGVAMDPDKAVEVMVVVEEVVVVEVMTRQPTTLRRNGKRSPPKSAIRFAKRVTRKASRADRSAPSAK